MARRLNAGALSAAIRGGFRRFKAGEKLGPTDEEIALNVVLDSPAFRAAMADLEAELGELDAKARRSLAGARNSTEVLRRLQRMAATNQAPPATTPASSLPASAVSAAARARMRAAKEPRVEQSTTRSAFNRQNLFRLAQRGPSQLVSSLFGEDQALGMGGATLAGIAAVKAITTMLGAAANFREFRRQGNSVSEATKRTALSTVQKVVTGLANITGVASGAGDVAALLGGTDEATGRRVVREEMERWFETNKERNELLRQEERDAVRTKSDQLARDHQEYLKLAQSYFDAAPVSDYTVVKAIQESLARRGNEGRTAVRDIFGRPVWNVVRRAGIEGAH